MWTVFHRIRQCGQHGRWALPSPDLSQDVWSVQKCLTTGHNVTQRAGRTFFLELFNEMGSTAWQCDPEKLTVEAGALLVLPDEGVCPMHRCNMYCVPESHQAHLYKGLLNDACYNLHFLLPHSTISQTDPEHRSSFNLCGAEEEDWIRL